MTENEDAYENKKNNENGDDIISCEDIVIESSPSDSLLFVYQTQWMKRFLQRYGNEICLSDAIYKTTRYALPLFFLAVKTNVDYQVVGAFVCEGESTENILAALRILKCWNRDWNPLYSMVDCCSDEINAVEELFPGIIYSCIASLSNLLVIHVCFVNT